MKQLTQSCGANARIGIQPTPSAILAWAFGFALMLFAATPAVAKEAAQPTSQVRPIEKWANFSSKKGKPKRLGDANVVFMRTPQAVNGRPITIYVNGEYHTTLLPGGYKGVRVCAGKNNIGMAYVGNIAGVDAHKNNPQHWFNMPKDSEKILYIALVKDSKGHPTLKALKSEPAIDMLKTLQEQTHALSRVSSKCAS